MANRKVAFGRVNRRQQTVDTRPFAEEMEMLLQMERMEMRDGDRHWIVADLTPNDRYLTGIIGFEDSETRHHFDWESSSWIKAVTSQAYGASSKALVPFAIDMSEKGRWTACAISPRVQPQTFSNGLAIAMNAARRSLGFPTDWEVDIVTSRHTVEEWIRVHPEVRLFRRTVRLPNPGHDLKDDIAEMEQLAARTKREEFVAGYDKTLRLTEQDGELRREVADKLDGMDLGQVSVSLEARGPGVSYKFNSQRSYDHAFIPDYGSDLQLGAEFILGALREYSQSRDHPQTSVGGGLPGPDDLPEG
jgi:hypothetical protein